MRTFVLSRLLPALVAVVGLLAAGCASKPCSDGPCGPCNPNVLGSGAPRDLPADPDPCLKYCKVWVPPVYREVPKLVCKGGGMRSNTKTVMKTTFVTEEVPGECYPCKTPDCTCEKIAVEVCPGGYQWKQVDCCWKYVYCPPSYKWCEKCVQEDGVTYCNQAPTTYRTKAVTCPTTRCDSEYVPPTYETVWVKELYRPGHYEWVAKHDCSPPPSCDGCATRTFSLPGACSCTK